LKPHVLEVKIWKRNIEKDKFQVFANK